jgi:protein SCO1/2
MSRDAADAARANAETKPAARARTREPFTARIVANPYVWVVAVGVLFGLPIIRSVTRRIGAAPAILGALPAFALTDQRGAPFGTRELAGKVWVADFIFTACAEACPLLSERMAEVGRRAHKLGPDFHLVSFTVDPERDTPAKLAAYGARYGANPVAWSFLTGPAAAIQAAVVDGFKVGMGRDRVPAPPGSGNGDFWQIFHGENLVLVDRQLRIRGYFPATPAGLDQLMEAVGRVANGG